MQPAIIHGERRMLRIVNVPLSIGAVAGFAVDVQDLEDARLELARHIESQRELADRMTAGTAQFEADRTLSFFNRPFAVMTRLDPEWLSEGPEFDRVIERMRDNQRLPEMRDFPAWKEERRGWFTSADEVIEEEWMLPNGDHLRIVAQPLPDAGLRLFLEDRTEQLRLASARDTFLRVRAATFDNLFEAISVFASDGRLYLWNRRFLEDWELDEEWLSTHPRVDELVPAMARKLVNPTAAAQIREMVRQTTNERQSASGRISMTDGRHFQFAAVPLPDGNALFTMVDVTDSSRIEAALRERASALEEADRVKTDFVANMSYELRTPLTSIGGFAELLGEGYAGELSGKAKDYVAAILESVERLSKLINDVLDLTTGDSRGVALEKERVDIAGLCRAAVETAQAPRRGKGAEAGSRDFGRLLATCSATPGACANRSSTCFRTRCRTPTERGESARRRRGQEGGADPDQRQWSGHSARRPAERVQPLPPSRRSGHSRRGGAGPRPSADPPVHRGTWRDRRARIREGQRHDRDPEDSARLAMILEDEQATARLGAQARPGAGRGHDHAFGTARCRQDGVCARVDCARSATRGKFRARALRSFSRTRSSAASLACRSYRIEDPAEIEELGLDSPPTPCLLVEWPERAGVRCMAGRARTVARVRAGGERILTAKVPPSWVGRWPPR